MLCVHWNDRRTNVFIVYELDIEKMHSVLVKQRTLQFHWHVTRNHDTIERLRGKQMVSNDVEELPKVG